MRKLFSTFTALFLALLFAVTAYADVIWNPVILVAAGLLQYWQVVLLVAVLIIVTIILIRKLKNKEDKP